jgi:hypothetical protein
MTQASVGCSENCVFSAGAIPRKIYALVMTFFLTLPCVLKILAVKPFMYNLDPTCVQIQVVRNVVVLRWFYKP